MLMVIPVISIVGKSKSGKTTLIEKLIPELHQRGYRVGTVKHHFHPDFEIDKPGKDTWRHAQAGSVHVILAAPDKIATIRQLKEELSLDEIVTEILITRSRKYPQLDLILVEGFKNAGKPALEIVRAERSTDLICDIEQLIGIVSDIDLNIPKPQFGLNDTHQITDFLIEYIQKISLVHRFSIL